MSEHRKKVMKKIPYKIPNTYFRAGFGEKKDLICSECGKKVYKLRIISPDKGYCDECINQIKKG